MNPVPLKSHIPRFWDPHGGGPSGPAPPRAPASRSPKSGDLPDPRRAGAPGSGPRQAPGARVPQARSRYCPTPHPPPGPSPARPHPGRPVGIALHLGEHQVPGLEGVRHAGSGRPKPREAAAAAAAVAAAAAGGEAGGGSEAPSGRRQTPGQRACLCSLGCAAPEVPASARHGRETLSLRTTCRDRGERWPMRRGVGEEQVNGIG